MIDLDFQVQSAAPVPYAAAPLLGFKLSIKDSSQTPIQSIALQCQIRLEPTRRRYSTHEQQQLLDLFGQPPQWSRTVHSLLWTHAGTIVPAFTSSTIVDLPVPCTYDLNIAAAKYFHALENGEVPMNLLFSGTIFYTAASGDLQIRQIPWEKEASFRLPVQVWRDMMNLYYPNTAWFCLRKDIAQRLYEYKVNHGLPTWEHAMEHLLAAANESVTT